MIYENNAHFDLAAHSGIYEKPTFYKILVVKILLHLKTGVGVEEAPGHGREVISMKWASVHHPNPLILCFYSTEQHVCTWMWYISWSLNIVSCQHWTLHHCIIILFFLASVSPFTPFSNFTYIILIFVQYFIQRYTLPGILF